MLKFLKQKNKKNERGFTLIETLVALSIFSISILGIMAVLSSGLTNTMEARKKMTATFLAQEGIEYMRNMRDTYVLYSTTANDGWSDFNTKMFTYCGPGKECFFNDENLDFTNPSMPINYIFLKTCPTDGCPNLKYDSSTGKYNSAGSGDQETIFVRSLHTEKIIDGETKITSTVSWGDGKKVSLSESLFNWTQ